MEKEEANSVVEEVEVAEEANPQENDKGTQEIENSPNAVADNVASAIDYSKKFSESSKEAQRLLDENKTLKKELELKDTVVEPKAPQQDIDTLYPGFEELDEDAQKNLIAYTDTVTRKAAENLQKDPAYAFAQKQYHENKWNSALESTIQKYPELAKTKDEFKSKYFNPRSVPDNIEEILGDIAKIHLFDQAKDIGAKESEKKQSQVDLERSTSSSNKETKVSRTLEDWDRMAKESPTKFRKLSKEFNEDISSGKI